MSPMKVEEIAEAVAKLPPDQLARFHRWFTAFRNSNQVTVISVTHLPRNTPLFMALSEGVSERITVVGLLIAFFTVALSLCVVGLVVISLWWSWLFFAAILGSLRDTWKLKKPEREPRSEGLLSSVTTSRPQSSSASRSSATRPRCAPQVRAGAQKRKPKALIQQSP